MATHKRSRTLKVALATATVLAAVGATAATGPFAGAATPSEGKIYGQGAEGAVKGSYVVMLHESAKGLAAKAERSALAGEYGGSFERDFTSIDSFSVSGMTETEAKRLAADPAVAKVVQNKTFKVSATQDNPPNWGLDRIDQAKPELDKKYNYPDSAGEGVTAYVIDTGVRITHKDFGGRASYGYDTVDNDETAQDGNGHGTHVAGTVAGETYGVAKKAKIVAVRVIGDDGTGTTEQVVAGMDWVTKNHKGPSVANMSLGGEVDEAVDAAVKKMVEAGVTLAVAAGNETDDAANHSPARVPEAISVASMNLFEQQSSFSNFGKLVDIFAPGEVIFSAGHGSDTAETAKSGTSMASPHVAGAAAVYLGAHKDAKPADISKALTDGATPDALKNVSAGTANKLLKIGE